MPKGPRGEKRPADVIGNAVKVMRIATGEIEDTIIDKDQGAVERGRLGGKKGGKIRAATLTKSQRRKIAQKGARKRWQNQ